MSYNSVEDYVKNAESNRNTAILNSLLESEPGMKELPEITPEDEGKFLQVNNGEPSWSNGSSGGGVLVVNDVNGTLDKTWQEINDAGFSVMVQTEGNERYYFMLADIHETGYMVVYFGDGPTYSYSAESANGYPTSGD